MAMTRLVPPSPLSRGVFDLVELGRLAVALPHHAPENKKKTLFFLFPLSMALQNAASRLGADIALVSRPTLRSSSPWEQRFRPRCGAVMHLSAVVALGLWTVPAVHSRRAPTLRLFIPKYPGELPLLRGTHISRIACLGLGSFPSKTGASIMVASTSVCPISQRECPLSARCPFTVRKDRPRSNHVRSSRCPEVEDRGPSSGNSDHHQPPSDPGKPGASPRCHRAFLPLAIGRGSPS